LRDGGEPGDLGRIRAAFLTVRKNDERFHARMLTRLTVKPAVATGTGMRVTIQDDPLPYVAKLALRDPDAIELVVIHCTELPDLATARQYGERVLYPDGSGASGHYYIDRDGAVHRYVPHDRVANHVRGHNAGSIGIELVNTGRFPDWYRSDRQAMAEPYPHEQIAALIELLERLCTNLPSLRHIAGHEDLDTAQVPASDDATKNVFRKRDPGPLFPWQRILDAGSLTRLHAPSPRSTESPIPIP
jgi:N-acetylmuramoyl-L-alanine amidase